jgi:hypothetical protein
MAEHLAPSEPIPPEQVERQTLAEHRELNDLLYLVSGKVACPIGATP